MINKKRVKVNGKSRTLIIVRISKRKCEFLLSSNLMSAVRSHAMTSVCNGMADADAWEAAYKWIVRKMMPTKSTFAHLVELNESFCGTGWYQEKYPNPFRFTSNLKPKVA